MGKSKKSKKSKIMLAIIIPLIIIVLEAGFIAAEKFSLIKRTPIQLVTTILNGVPKCDNPEYQPLLDEVLKKKLFSVSAEKGICDAVNLLDKKYDNIYTVLGETGIPTREQFIEKFINGLWKVNDINYYSGNENHIFHKIYIKRFGDSYNGIYLSTEREINYSFSITNSDTITIIHEMIHAMYPELPERTPMLYFVLSEGYASFWSEATTQDYLIDRGGACFDENSTYKISFLGAYRYSEYSKAYVDLLMTAGYDACEKYLETFDITVLENAITENIGIDGAAFIEKIWNIGHEGDDEPEVLNESVEYIDNAIMDNIFRKRVDEAQTPEELKKLFNYYRFAHVFVQAQHYNNGGFDTENYINTFDIEDTLFNKMYLAGIFDPLTKDEDEQRTIFDALLFVKCDEDTQDADYLKYPNLIGNELLYNGERLRIAGESIEETYELVFENGGIDIKQYFDYEEEITDFRRLVF